MDYSYFINPVSSKRRPAITRVLTQLHYNEAPNAISLAEGMPNEATFPIEEIQMTFKGGDRLELKGKKLGVALQYLPTQGYPPLLATLKEFMQHFHNPPNWDKCDLIVSNGSQCGISKSIEMVLQEGDPILVSNPVYSGVEITLTPHNPEMLAMAQDEFGIIPNLLRKILEERQARHDKDPSVKMPKAMYVNPTGANPNGSTMTLERKKEVYELACKYNFLILEDDPYYFMHFLEEAPPSFLSMDVEGRVIRFDSFSKVISSGLRMGWVVGPKELVGPMELHIQSSYLHASTLSQVIVNELLTAWGYEKLSNHFDFIRGYYKERRDCTLAAMKRHLTGLAEWSVPSAGMFMWIKVLGVRDVYELVTSRALKKNVIFTPGHAFMVDSSAPCSYIRTSYSKASPSDVDTAFKLLAELIREEQEIVRKKEENI